MSTDTSPDFTDQTKLTVSRLKQSQSYTFSLRLSAEQAAEMAGELDVTRLRKTTLIGSLSPIGAADWLLEAKLGATVEQPCVVTLDPVSTRIDEPVLRRFTPDMPEPEDGLEDEEVEMTTDENLEPLGHDISLIHVLREALALALPPYPRKDDAALDATVFAEPGTAPLTDEDTKPFAGLAALKDKLEKGN